MNAKHTYATSGPWFDTGETDKRPSKDGWLYTTIVADEKSEMPCVAIAYGETKDECQANARLIAAAPELLAALEAIVSRKDGACTCAAALHHPTWHASDCIFSVAQAAIRKAQGGAE